MTLCAYRLASAHGGRIVDFGKTLVKTPNLFRYIFSFRKLGHVAVKLHASNYVGPLML